MSEEQVLDEFTRLFSKHSGRYGRFAGREPMVTFSDELSLTHARNERRFAEVEPRGLHFFFAHEIRKLSAEHRLGLLAHELGHALHGPKPHGEADADRVARDYFGVEIKYDRRWRGRGLQVGRWVR